MEKDTENKRTLTGTLELKKTFDAGKIKQSFSHGRSRSVTVEVKKKRSFKSKTPTVINTEIKNDGSSNKISEELTSPQNEIKSKDLVDKNIDVKKEVEDQKQTEKKVFSDSKPQLKDSKRDTNKNPSLVEENIEEESEKTKKLKSLKLIKVPKKQDERRKGKLTISQALEENNERVRIGNLS